MKKPTSTQQKQIIKTIQDSFGIETQAARARENRAVAFTTIARDFDIDFTTRDGEEYVNETLLKKAGITDDSQKSDARRWFYPKVYKVWPDVEKRMSKLKDSIPDGRAVHRVNAQKGIATALKKDKKLTDALVRDKMTKDAPRTLAASIDEYAKTATNGAWKAAHDDKLPTSDGDKKRRDDVAAKVATAIVNVLAQNGLAVPGKTVTKIEDVAEPETETETEEPVPNNIDPDELRREFEAFQQFKAMMAAK